MRRRGVIVGFALLATLEAGAGTMAHSAVLGKGTIELTPSLGFTHNALTFKGSGAGGITHLTAIALLGYCLTDRFEIGGGLLMEHQSLSFPGTTTEKATSIGVTSGLQFNAGRSGRMLPFVRAAIGVATNSGVLSPGNRTTLIAPILQVGLRVVAGSSTSVNFGLGYRHQSSARGVVDLSANTVDAEIGVSFFPRRRT